MNIFYWGYSYPLYFFAGFFETFTDFQGTSADFLPFSLISLK